MTYHAVTIEVNVVDAAALLEAAMRHAVGIDHIEESQAREMLAPGGEVDRDACLQMLLDPGTLNGCDIEQSSSECLIADAEVE